MFKKKNVTILSLILLVFGGGLFVFNVLHAEDNELEDDDSRATTSTVNTSKTVTYEMVVTPARTVMEDQIQTIYLSDRDHDGIADSEDSHPDVANIYIVKDDNLNGIVDTFEYGK